MKISGKTANIFIYMTKKSEEQIPQPPLTETLLEPNSIQQTNNNDIKACEIIDNRYVAVSKFLRDENGLLKNTAYSFKEDGTVDWKAMIPSEFMVVNKEFFKSRNIEIPESTNGLDDKQVFILLGGIKELAKLRGIVSVEKTVCESNPQRAVVKCGVTFIDNYESINGMPKFYEEVASATIDNTNNFASIFLETIASNRAFVRAVRNALRIDIVGYDELAQTIGEQTVKSDEGGEIWNALVDAAKKFSSEKHPNGFKTFSEFKVKLIEGGMTAAEVWNDWKDIPPTTIFKLIGQLKKTTSKPS